MRPRPSSCSAPLLPVAATLSGLAVLGGARVTLAQLVEVPDEVLAAVLTLRAGTSGHAHPGWLPHVTLGRRIPRGRPAGSRRGRHR